MTKEEFIQAYDIEDGTVFLEEWEIFSKGIIGVSYDRKHIIYSYDKLVEALSEYYYSNKISVSMEKAVEEATEWIDYNTIRYIAYIAYIEEEFRPIVIIEMECKN